MVCQARRRTGRLRARARGRLADLGQVRESGVHESGLDDVLEFVGTVGYFDEHLDEHRRPWLLELSEHMDPIDFADSPDRLPQQVKTPTTPTYAIVKISGGQIVELHQDM